jgi:hypothetical protein
MRISDGPLSLAGERAEDIAGGDARLPIYSRVDSILPKAADCVMAEVGSRGLVAFVLVTPNASCLGLAILRRTSEEVRDATLVYLDGHISFEE